RVAARSRDGVMDRIGANIIEYRRSGAGRLENVKGDDVLRHPQRLRPMLKLDEPLHMFAVTLPIESRLEAQPPLLENIETGQSCSGNALENAGRRHPKGFGECRRMVVEIDGNGDDWSRCN